MTTRPIKVWDGTAWIDVGVYGPDTAGFVLTANNLSDLASASTALSNLGGTPTSRTITAGTGLTGGGDLSANRTLSVTGLTNNEIASNAAIDVTKLSGVAVEAGNYNTWRLPLIATNYYTAAAPFDTFTMVESDEVASFFVAGRTCTLDRIAIYVTSAGSAGSVIRLGVRAFNASTGAPGDYLLDAGTVDSTGTGTKAITISLSVTKDTPYVLTATLQGGASTKATVYGHLATLTSGPWAPGGSPSVGAYVAKASQTGALNNTGSFGSPSYNSAPRIWVRAA